MDFITHCPNSLVVFGIFQSLGYQRICNDSPSKTPFRVAQRFELETSMLEVLSSKCFASENKGLAFWVEPWYRGYVVWVISPMWFYLVRTQR